MYLVKYYIHITVEELYLQTIHTNPVKILFFAYYASVTFIIQ